MARGAPEMNAQGYMQGAENLQQSGGPSADKNARRGSRLTAKEYLKQYGESMARTQAVTEHLRQLRETAENLRGEQGQRIALDAAVAALVDAQEQTAAELSRLCALRSEILGTIDRVQDSRLRTLLVSRYVNGETFERIAVGMNYSWRQVIRMHGQALLAVKDVIECHIAPVV